MPMAAFFTQCPKVAEAEFCAVRITGHPHIPPGEYGFIELYCDEEACDCRRVFIHVITRKMEGGKPLASINFGGENADFYRKWMHGFEEDDFIQELKGPSLPPTPQSNLAPHFLELFQMMVKDEAYVDRLRRHYRLFREAIDKKHSARTMRKSGGNSHPAPGASCPCGSGKKYKKCCGRPR